MAILDEAILHRPVGGPKVMHDQLLHLIEMADRPNVWIQLVPIRIGAYPGLTGGFIIAGFNGREFVYVEDAFSGDVLEHGEDVATMKRIWETLRVDALSREQSIELIESRAKKWMI